MPKNKNKPRPNPSESKDVDNLGIGSEGGLTHILRQLQLSLRRMLEELPQNIESAISFRLDGKVAESEARSADSSRGALRRVRRT